MTQPISPLAVDLALALHGQTRDTANRLIDSLTEQLTEAQAELDAVRATISNLLAGDYQPSGEAIQVALWPAANVVARYRREVSE